MPAPGDVVNIVNPTDTDFKARYLTNKITIKANSNTYVPFEYMVYWMGNPDARNIDHRRRHREDEVRRLHTLYGAYYDEEAWEQNKPRIEAYTADGQRIITPIEDPTGEHATPITSPQSQEALVHQQLASQSTMIEQLKKQVETLTRQNQANLASVDTDSNPLIPTPPSTPDPSGYTDGMIPVGDVPTNLPPAPLVAPSMTPPPQSPATSLSDQLLGGPSEPAIVSQEVEEDSPSKVRTS